MPDRDRQAALLSLRLVCRGDDEGDRELAGVSETDFECGEAEFARAGGGGAVEMYGGFATWVVQDFEFSPEDAAHAGAKSLGDGLLAGEAGGEFFGPTAAVALFAFGVNAAEEALSETVQGSVDAGDFDGVDASSEASAVGPNSR